MQLRDLIPTEHLDPSTPHLTALAPSAALPGGRIEISGTALGPEGNALPTAFIGETPAAIALSGTSRAIVVVPEGAVASDLHLVRAHSDARSNALPLRVAVP